MKAKSTNAEDNLKPLSAEEAEQERTKWNVPCWQDTSAYEYTEHYYSPALVNDQLRWEFLRRNKRYRESWRDENSCRLVFGLIEPLDPSLNGNQLDGRNVLFIDSIFHGSPVSMAASKDSDETQFIKKYGEFLLGAEDNGLLILGFNPAQPVTPQITRAEEILNHHRNKLIEAGEPYVARESQIEKPSWLLRALDAHNEGVSLLTIGREIYMYDGDDADQKADARAIAHNRLNAAMTCWERVVPVRRNVRP